MDVAGATQPYDLTQQGQGLENGFAQGRDVRTLQAAKSRGLRIMLLMPKVQQAAPVLSAFGFESSPTGISMHRCCC